MKSLVTGGAGFIGAHVVNELINMGHEVVVLDDLSGGYKDNVNTSASFIEGSITNKVLIDEIFESHNIDYVYHLAAYAAEGLSHFIRKFNYENNLIGSINLVNASIKHKVKCFVFTSSIAVYGAGQLPMREDMVPLPEDPYGIAKLAIEQDLKAAKEIFDLDYIIFRPHNVYGEYQNIADRYRNVLGIFMNQILQDKSLTIFGDGEQTRAFSYIGDVAPYIAKSVDLKNAYGETINIGADKQFTVNELADTIMNVMNREVKKNYLPARNEVMHAHSDHNKAKAIFGIENYTSLSKGIEKMAKWVEEHGARETPKFENIEITEKLPSVWLEN